MLKHLDRALISHLQRDKPGWCVRVLYALRWKRLKWQMSMGSVSTPLGVASRRVDVHASVREGVMRARERCACKECKR